jgi:radical SAM protein with 4Fe4S-binding SPASM domain
MRKDLFDFLEVLSSQRKTFSFALLSNGSFISQDIAETLKVLKPTFVQVSMEGGEKTHDTIRGRGNFNSVIHAIKHLRHAGINTLVFFNAHKDNFREYESVAELGMKLGVSNIWTDRFIPAGTGLSMADRVLSTEEMREFFSIVKKAKQKIEGKWRCKTTISMNRALQFILGENELYRCSAGGNLLIIGTDGSLYPCRRMPVSVGNVTLTDLSCLYETSPFLIKLRDRKFISAGCERRFYVSLCNGGLRCLSYALSRDPFVRDPGCWMKRNDDYLKANTIDWSDLLERTQNEHVI